jgi:catechol 2,3-dioxygenase-like lactoylglutathione lyase family enzyme
MVPPIGYRSNPSAPVPRGGFSVQKKLFCEILYSIMSKTVDQFGLKAGISPLKTGINISNARQHMMIRSLFLVTLVVDDYDRAKAFYCDGLGFDCLQDEPQPEGKRWVVVKPRGGDGAAFLLAQAADETQRAAIGNQTGGRVGFFLKTDDFARDHAAMLAAGIRFLEEPRHEVYGTVAVFADPYGNTFDLIQHTAA